MSPDANQFKEDEKEESVRMRVSETDPVEGELDDDDGNGRSIEPVSEGATAPELPEPYEMLGLLGHGGMGAVYRVRNRKLEKEFALKVIKPEYSGDAASLKRFLLEIEATSGLSHPNVASVYEQGTTLAGEPFLVMDLAEGDSLAAIIERDGPLPPARALGVFAQIAAALEHAHKAGVVHRDIKPTNVILTRNADGEDVAKVVDFGIARIQPSARRETMDLTETGAVFGTPHYMSPEQCLGFLLDERSDIYSLGCLMYEVLTGKPPYSGSNPVQVVVAHINADVPDLLKELSGRSDKMTGRLAQVVSRCLQKELDERYQHISEVASELELVAQGKAPERGVVVRKEKHSLTAKQAAGLACGALLVLIYASILAASTGNMWASLGMMSVWGLLIIWGGYSLLATQRERFRHLLQLSQTSGEWWQLSAYLFAGAALMIVGFLPVSLCLLAAVTVPFNIHLTFDPFSQAVTIDAMFLHLVFVFLLLMSFVGMGVSRVGALARNSLAGAMPFKNRDGSDLASSPISGRRKRLGRFSAEFVALVAAIVVVFMSIFPSTTANGLGALAWMMVKPHPTIGLALGRASLWFAHGDNDALLRLADLYFQAGRADRAVHLLLGTHVTELNKDGIPNQAFRKLAGWLENSGPTESWKDARKHFDLHAKANPSLYELKTRLHLYVGDFDAAGSALRAAVAAGIAEKELLPLRLRIDYGMRRTDAVIQDLAEIIHSDSDDVKRVTALVLRGRLLDSAGQTQEALSDYRQISSIHGPEVKVPAIYAFVFKQLNDRKMSDSFREHTFDRHAEHLTTIDQILLDVLGLNSQENFEGF